ncbi:MAG: hypothetical protein NKF37_00035 [Tropheryma whipplei]|uniref:hypothetical protein n=1 Tax=Tropheryma whipplei TaxID=2039 RepID=UPI0002E0197D|nr:hypothetical protein [Tropheryma whipplei]MCO8189937.1 hypothetical protein [Tropheryma whipplei]
MPKTTTSVTQPRQSSFFPLLTGFFTYLFLLTRPHKRRLFMAGLVRKYYRDSTARTVLSATDIFLFSFVITFAIAVLIGMSSALYFIIASVPGAVVYESSLWQFVWWSSILVSFVVAYLYLQIFSPSDRSFLLRYSYYSQTPSFQNPTKRRQILLLDTVTRYGSKYYRDLAKFWLTLLAILVFIGALFIFVTQNFSILNPIFLLLFLLSCLISFLVIDSLSGSLVRKLLYNLHIRRHGPIPKELTDIVTQAYEIYPQVTT